jgi:hypothetical protein
MLKSRRHLINKFGFLSCSRRPFFIAMPTFVPILRISPWLLSSIPQTLATPWILLHVFPLTMLPTMIFVVKIYCATVLDNETVSSTTVSSSPVLDVDSTVATCSDDHIGPSDDGWTAVPTKT